MLSGKWHQSETRKGQLALANGRYSAGSRDIMPAFPRLSGGVMG